MNGGPPPSLASLPPSPPSFVPRPLGPLSELCVAHAPHFFLPIDPVSPLPLLRVVHYMKSPSCLQ